MYAILLGASAAILASMLFSAGLILQSLEASALPGGSFGAHSFAYLLRRRRWLLGVGLMLVGFGFHVIALTLAPLTVVQPALSAGLVVLLMEGARRFGDRMSAQEVAAVAVIGAGVLGLAVTSGERSVVDASDALLALALAPLAAVALLPRVLGALRAADAHLSLPAMAGAGAAYALTGLTTKLVSDRLADGDLGAAGLWLAVTAAASGLALIDQTIALQGRPASQVGVVIYIAPVVIPVLAAVALLGEAPASALATVVLALSVVAVCAAAAVLAASRHVTAVAA